jgi:hypothetical protein
MGLLEQQNFLARLYTNEGFRHNFIENPNHTGKKHGLSKNEIEELIAIYPNEIEAFALSLFYKRLREVERILPLTKKALGRDFENIFREFIKEFNPQSVKKHHEDALQFCMFLYHFRNNTSLGKNVVMYEFNKLRVHVWGKNFVIKIFDYDFRKLTKHQGLDPKKIKKRKTVVIWINLRKFKRHYIL